MRQYLGIHTWHLHREMNCVHRMPSHARHVPNTQELIGSPKNGLYGWMSNNPGRRTSRDRAVRPPASRYPWSSAAKKKTLTNLLCCRSRQPSISKLGSCHAVSFWSARSPSFLANVGIDPRHSAVPPSCRITPASKVVCRAREENPRWCAKAFLSLVLQLDDSHRVSRWKPLMACPVARARTTR
ncbi:hypothetical protein LX36DRAFT_454501 [Colletotrichum falcatum]|nr:hypothetical protein LX36DRAFT_454501 [Colletotrichum falcatum]